MNRTTPIWFENRTGSTYEALDVDLAVDVLVIGGGITGVTAAYLAGKSGSSVALVERELLGGRDTGHTTAHLTYMTDTRLSDLIATFSRDEAKKTWEAGQVAMQFIERTVNELGIDCRLNKVPGYLAAAKGKEAKHEASLLNQEAIIARSMGFDVQFLDTDPITSRPAIRFSDQMEFHPLRYVDAVAEEARTIGVSFFENTEVTEFTGEGIVKARGHTIRYKKVFIATHVPLQGTASTLGAALFQTKLAPYTSYALRAKMIGRTLPEMIWSDTADPFLYLRIQKTEDGTTCILGGEDHKTGQETSPINRYEALAKQLSGLVAQAEITHSWSGQVVETVDGLPFIGPISNTEFIATGFSGNGMTLGTVGALMFTDWLCGERNAWSELFDPSRRTPSALGEYLHENKDYPVRMITDRWHVEDGDPESVPAGEGKVLKHDGERLAVHRDANGHLTVCSAVCPHMGCIVAWNDAERTWDCPCHGSRFKATGEVIAGPAEADLERC